VNLRGTNPLGMSPAASQRPVAQQYGAPHPVAAASWNISTSGDGLLFPAYSRLFVDARRVLGLTEFELARRLGTEGRVVLALEQARFEYLPPWPETVRIVSAYLHGLGMDPRPVLHALAQDIERQRAAFLASSSAAMPAHPATAYQTPQSSHAMPATQVHDYDDEDDDEDAPGHGRLAAVRAKIGSWGTAVSSGVRSAVSPVSRLSAARFRDASVRQGADPRALGRRKARRAAFGIGAPLLVALAVANADIVRSATSMLPKPVSRALVSAADQVRTQFAPVRDGLRWIEVDDPRSRRGDKLQTARR
jgi:hypothetical protein